MKKNFLKWATVAFMFTMGCFMFSSCSDDDDNGGGPTPPSKLDPSKVAAENLIAYFAFEGNGNDEKGTVTVAEEKNATYPTGRRGKAYFGGGADTDQAYLKYNLSSTNKLSTLKAATFAFWANLKWTGDGGPEPMIYQINGTVDAPWGNFSLLQTRTTANDSASFTSVFVKDGAEWSSQKAPCSNNRFKYGTWMHMAVTYDNVNSLFYVYVNGKLVDLGDGFSKRWAGPGETTPLGDLKFAGATSFFIGAWADNVNKVQGTWAPADSYKGGLDELRIYDRALTATEVQELYDAEFDNINE